MGIEFLDVDAHGRETLLRYFTPARYTTFYELFIAEFPHLRGEVPLRDVSLVLNLWEEWKIRSEGGPLSTASGAPPPPALGAGDGGSPAAPARAARQRAAPAVTVLLHAEGTARAPLAHAPAALPRRGHGRVPSALGPAARDPRLQRHGMDPGAPPGHPLHRQLHAILLEQLEDYVAGRARDRFLELTARPANELGPDERAAIVRGFFMVDWARHVRPVPRYWELLQKRGRGPARARSEAARGRVLGRGADRSPGALQPRVDGLRRARGRRRAPRARAGRGAASAARTSPTCSTPSAGSSPAIVPRWTRLAERGQVELSTTPYYHPILPLLCDTRRGAPGAPAPPAAAALRAPRGRSLARSRGPREPRAALRPAGRGDVAGGGVGVARGGRRARARGRPLGRERRGRPAPLAPAERASARVGLPPVARGGRRGARAHHAVPRSRAVRCDRLHLLGRPRPRGGRRLRRERRVDRRRVGGGAAAGPAHGGRVPRRRERLGALPESGREFLDRLYGALERERRDRDRDDVRGDCATPTERIVTRIHSGSWIEASYRIWIGHAEDRQAWAALGRARDGGRRGGARRAGRPPSGSSGRAGTSTPPRRRTGSGGTATTSRPSSAPSSTRCSAGTSCAPRSCSAPSRRPRRSSPSSARPRAPREARAAREPAAFARAAHRRPGDRRTSSGPGRASTAPASTAARCTAARRRSASSTTASIWSTSTCGSIRPSRRRPPAEVATPGCGSRCARRAAGDGRASRWCRTARSGPAGPPTARRGEVAFAEVVELAVPFAALGLAPGDGSASASTRVRGDVEVERLPRHGFVTSPCRTRTSSG